MLKMFMPVVQNAMAAINMFKIAMDAGYDVETKWQRIRNKENKANAVD